MTQGSQETKEIVGYCPCCNGEIRIVPTGILCADQYLVCPTCGKERSRNSFRKRPKGPVRPEIPWNELHEIMEKRTLLVASETDPDKKLEIRAGYLKVYCPICRDEEMHREDYQIRKGETKSEDGIMIAWRCNKCAYCHILKF
jgi:transposase-like protein